ncbi:MAG: hypothetical protein HY954_10715 [Deltaproteobacteria bacterium]|nr:hypothetical protein [Deltaproteobacteria bacterium]
MSERKQAFNLFLISFLSLFGEMVFIRYLSSNIYLLSYYKNAVLIAIFLGLGIGFMVSRSKRNPVEFLPLATLVLVCIIIYFNDYLRIDLDYNLKDESIWPEFWANTRARSVPIFGVLIVFYIMMTLYFIPLGQETMRAMAAFKPLKAYSINIAGALAGIIAFSVAGWLWTTPLVWFAVFLPPLLWWSYLYSNKTVFYLNIASVVITLFLVLSAHWGPEVWSPYSRIRVYPFSAAPGSGFISTTNGNPQVGSMNFDIEYTGPEAKLNLESRRIYEIPYHLGSPSTVMVVGAGAGNETAMALRHGAKDVDAVEIDPVFITLGSHLSPHRPFIDKRVNVHVDDARAFFHKTLKKYDLIVIGFLDSQYHLTHMSNIRTENFVYTYESLKRTKEILTENGILQLNYNAPREDMRAKLFFMLKDIYGADLVVYAPRDPVSGNISIVAGPGVREVKRDLPGLERSAFSLSGDKKLVFPTDDWPFLYLEGKKIPREYWSMLIVIPLLSFALIKGITRSKGTFSLKFFMLGLGFMLLETKSITSFALLFGSTVTVVSLVLAAILSSILLANFIVKRWYISSVRVPYILIFASLIALYFMPLGLFIGLGWAAKVFISLLLIAAPVFFASFVFSISFSRSDRMDIDMGSNIFGAVVGGLSEYLSMALGFNGLYVISAVAYLIAFVIDLRGKDL